MQLINVNPEKFEKFIEQFLGEDEAFLIRQDLTKIVGNEIIFIGYVQNLKDNTIEKGIINIDISKLIEAN